MSAIVYRGLILKPGELSEQRWLPAMADAGLNTLALHAARLPDEIDALIAYVQGDAGRRTLEACARYGVRVEYQMHTASWLLPRERFFRDPTMYRMNLRGERVPEGNFCPHSEAAWEVVAPNLARLVAALPSQTGRYLLFADDNVSGVDEADGACHCERCAGLSAADQALLYANRLLRLIRAAEPAAERPGAEVSYLAYLGTLHEPPRAVAPEAGVWLEFAPIRRCYRHALDDAACAVNRAQLDALRRAIEALPGLPRHATEYWLDASRHSGWRRPARRLPVAEEVMARDAQTYARLGFTSVASYAVWCDREYWEVHGPPPVSAYGAALAAAGASRSGAGASS